MSTRPKNCRFCFCTCSSSSCRRSAIAWAPDHERQYWLRYMRPSLASATSGTTTHTSSTSAPPMPPFSVWRLMPHLAAHFSMVGYQDGSLELRAICFSKAFLARAGGVASAALPLVTLCASASSLLVTALSCDSTCWRAGCTIWKNGTSVPAVSIPATMPTSRRNLYLRAYFHTRLYASHTW